MLLLLLALALTLAFSLAVTALFRFQSRGIFLLSLFLLAFANIVLTAEIAGLLRLLTPAAFLGIHALLLLGAGAGWYAAGRPPLMPAFRTLPTRQALAAFARCNPHLAVLLVFIGLAALVNAGLILVVPPNNVDSMTYHLSRAGYWLQQGSFLPWPTNNPRQTTMPFNAEVAILWTMLFTGSDRLAGFVQWFSFLFSGISIYGLARVLKASSTQAVFAAAIWATLPQVLLQSSSTQNDLVTAVFLVSMIFLLAAGIRQRDRRLLLLSAVAAGLGFGTKATFLLSLPFLGIGVLAWIFFTRQEAIRRLILQWIGLCAAGVLLLGSYIYIQNYLYFRSPLGQESPVTRVSTTETSRGKMAAQNSILYLYQSADLSGLPGFIQEPAARLKTGLARGVIKALGLGSFSALRSASWTIGAVLSFPVQNHEDISWFGALFLILFLPALGVGTWRALRERESLPLLLIFILAGSSLVTAAMLVWTPYKSRYFVPAVTLCSPLMAFLYPRRKPASSILLYLAIFTALVILTTTTLANQSKPLAGPNAIWGQSRLDLQTVNRVGMRPVAEMVEKHVPLESSLGLRTGLEGWDYLFFGPRLQRRITQLDPFIEDLDAAALRANGIEYVLVEPHQRSFLALPAGLYWVDQVSGWMLFTLDPRQAGTTDDALLLGATDPKQLLDVSPDLVGDVGLLELIPGSWNIETYEGRSLLWLGDSLGNGLSMYLWSTGARDVTLRLALGPGPSRAGPERTLRFITIRDGVYYEQSLPFSGETQLEIPLRLEKGLNQFQMTCGDAADVPVLANGDPRTLMIRLDHITVVP